MMIMHHSVGAAMEASRDECTEFVRQCGCKHHAVWRHACLRGEDVARAWSTWRNSMSSPTLMPPGLRQALEHNYATCAAMTGNMMAMLLILTVHEHARPSNFSSAARRPAM
jgi:hypothetical protein